MERWGTGDAFGSPGIDPRWQHGDKSGIGTAYSNDSRVWFTLWRGILTECYYPLIDRPQTRDLQFLITDPQGLFHEERRHLEPTIQRLDAHSLGYRIRNVDPGGRYALAKEVIVSPHLPAVLQHVQLIEEPGGPPLTLHALVAPHLDGGGQHNNGYVLRHLDRTILVAERNGYALAMAATAPFSRASAGFVGSSDLWSDITAHHEMTWQFDRAQDGNVALAGELELPPTKSFTLVLAFGLGIPSAVSTLLQAFAHPFAQQRARFQAQWARKAETLRPLHDRSGDGGRLYRCSASVLLAHEDKSFPGAFIASLAIPWGNAENDSDRGGYHLVWTRDLYQSATGLLASGHAESALRSLIYLAATQRPDGSFPQNSWLDGTAYWSGLQLDEVAFPILLAGQLSRARALDEFEPTPMVRAAARFLVLNGPATGQERWEEAAGYSPSTIATNVAALVVAAELARSHRDGPTAELLGEYSSFLAAHVDQWTVTEHGTILPGTPRHFLRILPTRPEDPSPSEDLDTAELTLANQAPGGRTTFPAKEIVDAGFLELVRYGVRAADDPVIVDSLRVVDAALKVETPFGPVWRRYPHDGYGQKEDGRPFGMYGRGGGWPLLTGERGHYELAAGRDPAPYLSTLEQIAGPSGLIPEQVWDLPDLPTMHLALGRPTGAAMPLLWAHAEYLKLLRSAEDRAVFDRVPAVAERFAAAPGTRRPALEIWKTARQPRSIGRGTTLRILAGEPFVLHWSRDGWSSVEDTESTGTGVGIDWVDVPTDRETRGPLVFTFRWRTSGAWEGTDHRVDLR